MPPDLHSSVPERSALGGRAGTLGADVGPTSRSKERTALILKPSRLTFCSRSAGSGRSRCGAGSDTATCQLSDCELQQNGDKGAGSRESACFSELGS